MFWAKFQSATGLQKLGKSKLRKPCKRGFRQKGRLLSSASLSKIMNRCLQICRIKMVMSLMNCLLSSKQVRFSAHWAFFLKMWPQQSQTTNFSKSYGILWKAMNAKECSLMTSSISYRLLEEVDSLREKPIKKRIRRRKESISLWSSMQRLEAYWSESTDRRR